MTMEGGKDRAALMRELKEEVKRLKEKQALLFDRLDVLERRLGHLEKPDESLPVIDRDEGR
jgi:hypothetical protein